MRAPLSRRRRLAGLALAVAGLPLLTAAAHRGGLALTADISLFLAAVVAVALTGGLWPALLAAVGGFLLLNYFFVPPLHTFTIATTANWLAVAAFVVVAAAVSAVVDLAARRTAQARTLSTLAAAVLRGGPDPLSALLHQLRDTFALESVTLLERRAPGRAGAAPAASTAARLPLPGDRPTAARLPLPGGGPATGPSPSFRGDRPVGAASPPSAGDRPAAVAAGPAAGAAGPAAGAAGPAAGAAGWSCVAAVGEPVAAGPAEGDACVADGSLVLVLRGRRLARSDKRIVDAFAAQAAVARRQQRLAVAAEGDKVRTALLAAVSHDLRSPLASAKAAVAGLRSDEVEFAPEDRAELLATADESLDHLAALVANLLDMSRLQAGALGMTLTDIGLEDAVPAALTELGVPASPPSAGPHAGPHIAGPVLNHRATPGTAATASTQHTTPGTAAAASDQRDTPGTATAASDQRDTPGTAAAASTQHTAAPASEQRDTVAPERLSPKHDISDLSPVGGSPVSSSAGDNCENSPPGGHRRSPGGSDEGGDARAPGSSAGDAPASRPVVVRLPDDLPAVRADPGLLDRVLVNIVGNALRHSPGTNTEILGLARGDMVELHVVDHGPGVPEDQWDLVFQPFQRLGDRDNHAGVGLGLALSRGLAEAMGGTLRPAKTPGGGLTMILTLPSAPA